MQDRSIEQCVKFSTMLWAEATANGKGRTIKPLILAAMRKRSADRSSAYIFEMASGPSGFAMPMRLNDKLIGYILVQSAASNLTRKTLDIVSRYVELLVSNAVKTEELTRLSATIRPRAIALSTVHTVHRIINSTLNLDELVSRLAHLTAQVLRVHRCAIYLLDNSTLVCKALIGHPKNILKNGRLRSSSRLEGRVARTADIQLRKKILCIPLIDEDVIGVVTVTQKKDKKDFNPFDLEILTTLAEEAVIAIKNAQLYEEQRRVTFNTIRSLAVVLGSRAPQAGSLSPEVFANLALHIAQALKLSEEQIQAVHYAALLKETTKIGIPDEILKKKSKLTGEEFRKLREHTLHGARIIQNFESLKTVAPIILYSREKYDGTGYPEGLKGETIPIGARILAVLNAFEAIVHGRPYRGKSTEDEALAELRANSGTQFDPKVVECFAQAVKKDGVFKILKNAG